MKILVFSAKEFEIPYLKRANRLHFDVDFTNQSLNIESARLAEGYDCIAIFTNDDASGNVLRELHLHGVKYIVIRATGYDNVNLTEAENLGICVANVPEYSPQTTAEALTNIAETTFSTILLWSALVRPGNEITQKTPLSPVSNK